MFRRVLIFAALSTASLVHAWHAPGWPANHEGVWFAQRTWVYARHFSWFDVLPIWASIDAWGFGSPMPVAYHKLFYMLAAPLALALGSVKTAILVALAALLTLGALGVHATLRLAGASRLAGIVGGCCFITANYTVTNWLVRGAMAELAGAMLVPWLLYYFLRSLGEGRLHVGLGAVLGLIWLAHSVLAYFIFLVVGTAYLALAVSGRASWSLAAPRTAWRAVACFACFVVPYLVPLAVLGRNYDFARIITPPFRPQYQFRPAGLYLWDTSWLAMGEKSFGVTVQLDLAMLALLAISAVMFVSARTTFASLRATLFEPLLPLALILAIALALQLPFTGRLYEIVPGAAFLQFPWRLLALVTPALVVLAVRLADAWPRVLRMFGLGGAGAWMCVSSIAFAPMTLQRLELEPVVLTQVEFSYPAFHEYEPKRARSLPTLAVTIADAWTESGCRYVVVQGRADEVPEAIFDVTCAQPAMLPLPLFSSPLHRVQTEPGGDSRACADIPRFVSVCGVNLQAGTSRVSVSLPNMISLLRWGGASIARLRGD